MTPSPTTQTVIDMLAAINNNTLNLAYESAEKYLETLPKSQNDAFRRIKRLIEDKPKKFMLLGELPNQIKKFLYESESANDNVYLQNDVKMLLDELLLEWSHKETFRYHNLPIRSKILLYGATGNGKTTIARHIATLSNLPFIEINSDSVVESLRGASSQNINQIFNQIKDPCVMFWDEIDTIGRKRGKGSDSAASVENERMINSVLVNMSKMSNDVIFIGATNRYDILDSAFLRRFDVKFELNNPSEIQKDAFLNQMLDYYKLPNDYYIEQSEEVSQSYSDLKLEIQSIAREYVISQLTPL